MPQTDAEITTNVWHTIDSAPRDGTAVLLWHGKRCTVGRFREFADGTRVWEIGQATGGVAVLDCIATHWAPLPEPPEDAR